MADLCSSSDDEDDILLTGSPVHAPKPTRNLKNEHQPSGSMQQPKVRKAAERIVMPSTFRSGVKRTTMNATSYLLGNSVKKSKSPIAKRVVKVPLTERRPVRLELSQDKAELSASPMSTPKQFNDCVASLLKKRTTRQYSQDEERASSGKLTLSQGSSYISDYLKQKQESQQTSLKDGFSMPLDSPISQHATDCSDTLWNGDDDYNLKEADISLDNGPTSQEYGNVQKITREEDALDEFAERWPKVAKSYEKQPSLPLSVDESNQETNLYGNFNKYLFDYQQDGIRWLYHNYKQRKGAILGDDMGLGKTIQVIGFLSIILQKEGTRTDKVRWFRRRNKRNGKSLIDSTDNPGPILIVLPTTLLQNWEEELNTWMCCNLLKFTHKREQQYNKLDEIARGEYEIVICSYEMVKMTITRLKNIEFHTIIFDEVHRLKNEATQIYQAAIQLRCPRKIGLTGTLIQNNLLEFFCLVNLIVPDVLGDREMFNLKYATIIKHGRKKSATAEEVRQSKIVEEKLRKEMIPHYLRRTKSVNPEFDTIFKKDRVVFCPLSCMQKRAYMRALASPDYQLIIRKYEPCDCRLGTKPRGKCCHRCPGDKDVSYIWDYQHPDGEPCKNCPMCLGFACMALLWKIANHIDHLRISRPDTKSYVKDFAAMILREEGTAVSRVDNFDLISTEAECGKLPVLQKLLQRWYAAQEKVLLFSKSTRTLDILKAFLLKNGYSSCRLDGNTKVSCRQEIIKSFNEGPFPTKFVLLISTTAGGLGLNITGATKVVLFDPCWNPSMDNQAQDRAYRIGQKHNVYVYRLISIGTIEEMMYIRQIYKLQLRDATLEGKVGPRYFEGIQAEKHGEIFGLQNLLQFNENGIFDTYKLQ